MNPKLLETEAGQLLNKLTYTKMSEVIKNY